MAILGFSRRRADLAAVVNRLRAGGTKVTGPIRTRKGLLIFSIANCIVTAEELLELKNSGPLSTERIQAFLSEPPVEKQEVPT